MNKPTAQHPNSRLLPFPVIVAASGGDIDAINTVTERRTDVDKFIKIVRQYTDIQELTYENVHEFIDRILIHEPDLETDTRKVEIFYSFVGQIVSEDEPAENISYIRRERRNVKSIVI